MIDDIYFNNIVLDQSHVNRVLVISKRRNVFNLILMSKAELTD